MPNDAKFGLVVGVTLVIVVAVVFFRKEPSPGAQSVDPPPAGVQPAPAPPANPKIATATPVVRAPEPADAPAVGPSATPARAADAPP